MHSPDQPTNPYAPPLTESKAAEIPGDWPPGEVGLWRDGAWLVARRNANFPLVCPVTNEPAVTRVPSYFPWAAKDLYPLRFGLVVGVLYYLTQVKHTLLREHRIGHTTIQVETRGFLHACISCDDSPSPPPGGHDPHEEHEHA